MNSPSLLFFKTLPSKTHTTLIQVVAKSLNIPVPYLDVGLYYGDVIHFITTEAYTTWDMDFFLDYNTRQYTVCPIGGDLTWLDDHLAALSGKKLSLVRYLNVFVQASNLPNPIKQVSSTLSGGYKVSFISADSPCQIITDQKLLALPYDLYLKAQKDRRPAIFKS